MHKNIIITGANSPYYEGLLTLINSIQKHSYDIIDEIVVYDFGLTKEETDRLNNLSKTRVISTKEEVASNFPVYNTFSSVKTLCHFLKMYALNHSLSLSENVCWIDSGSVTLKSVKPIFDEIESDGIFVVGDVHLNKKYTHKKCIEIMKATESELNDVQLSSGLFGFKTTGNFRQLILDAWNYSIIEGCIDGFEENHRHDQSVLSILCSRYSVKKNDIDLYGYWTDHNRTYQKALELGAVIFAGRRSFYEYSELKYKSNNNE